MAKSKAKERKRLSKTLVTDLLTEAGYRCAVPTCRTILAIDMHHIWEVKAGGGDDLANLIALCPNCHRLYHKGIIREESVYAYKAMLVSLSNAFDLEAIDKLLFLQTCPPNFLIISGDGVLRFSRLIAAELVKMELKANNANQLVTYSVSLSDKGKALVEAWKSGRRAELQSALGDNAQP